jgi:lipoprotein-anchoring transpeptidase ErfK/SrfK
MDSTATERLRKKIGRVQPGAPEKFIAVEINNQRLYLVDAAVAIRTFTISTSRFGVGNREGSFMTPLGVHRIAAKIGSGAPAGRIFRDRCDTGIDWHGGLTEENLVLTRILRLEGLEEGINRGPRVDSFERCIYIHGTNQESLIGTLFTHGCVCMMNADIITLFDAVEEGTIVVIV